VGDSQVVGGGWDGSLGGNRGAVVVARSWARAAALFFPAHCCGE